VILPQAGCGKFVRSCAEERQASPLAKAPSKARTIAGDRNAVKAFIAWLEADNR